MDYPKITNQRVLITGGAGFIGSNLCEDLLKYDNEVVCLDNFSTGRMENIAESLEHKNFKLMTGDIRIPEDCSKAADGINIILQEAALGSVPRSINDPVTTNAVNVGGFLNMLVVARDAKVKRLVYAASSSTYGDFELIIIDDGSTDDSREKIRPYEGRENINVIYQTNKGLTTSANVALELARGKYFMRLDADDWLEPQALTILCAEMEQDTGYQNCQSSKIFL